jgi:hypothetical protein
MSPPTETPPIRPGVLTFDVVEGELPEEYVRGALDGLASFRDELEASSGLIEAAASDEGRPTLDLVLQLLELCRLKLQRATGVR